MPKLSDICPKAAFLYFLPVDTRVPLKFGAEVTTYVTVARVRVTVVTRDGRSADGWGETPLSVQWVWPQEGNFEERDQSLKDFCAQLVTAWARFEHYGDPVDVGITFQEQVLRPLHAAFNRSRADDDQMPWLAALVCCSLFDLAVHDAFGKALDRPVYQTYSGQYLNRPLSDYLEAVNDARQPFHDRFPCDFLVDRPTSSLPAWHLVGGLDPVEAAELSGHEPDDGYPVLLRDWIERDGLTCLKVKLRGDDFDWDCQRLVAVGRIAIETGVRWLTADFNCSVTVPEYVDEILDRLRDAESRIYGMLLYVEQPFPYDLEANPIDVHSVSARKPLFLDESAHDWHLVRLRRELGWTGVALKTCKTQSGALLSACWAKAHGMTLMVQDLTNPMLAQVPHVLLAANVGTIMGVETNAMQFYPDASQPEAIVHPGLYRRREGRLNLSTIGGPGFGYRESEIKRELPEVAAADGN
ncbi:MAG: hypothetical protein M2R45_04027 [Verrucomicrobia subdivision 3 bacterium]|nr:hypothetical protein [Limisphaerales bacterium]MCS1416989.1 hypothetical protein [Limisphaerales bacterium]